MKRSLQVKPLVQQTRVMHHVEHEVEDLLEFKALNLFPSVACVKNEWLSSDPFQCRHL